MTDKYKTLFENVTFGNGVQTKNRFAMAPMLVFASNEDGSIGQDDFDYFFLRNDTGGIIITGAAAVSKEGLDATTQLTAYDDGKTEGLKKLANIIKAKGNKAILQLQNAGREAAGAYDLYGKVYAPSAINFPFLPYVPEELSKDQILSIIDNFGQAARRACEAGFDGVEIHGANHYLLQQFLSSYSNRREDEWGGNLEKRLRFPLAVLNRVREFTAKQTGKDFIVGYRLSPEEVHGSNIGYTIDDALLLVQQLIENGVDYIHLSTSDYKAMPQAGGKGEAIALTVKKFIGGRVPMLLAGGIDTPAAALDALSYTDIVALGRAVLIDPAFVTKMENGNEDAIEFSVAGRPDKLAFSDTLLAIWKMKNTRLPPLKGLTY